MVYLVTGRRIDDGWPFAGEVTAPDVAAAATLVRTWGVEAEFVKELGSGRVELCREGGAGEWGSGAVLEDRAAG